MNKASFNYVISSTKQYGELLSQLLELKRADLHLPLIADGVSEGALASLLLSLVKDTKKDFSSPILLITKDERQGNRLNEYFKLLGLKSELFPLRDFNFYEMTASRDLEHERLKVLCGTLFSSLDIVISTPDASLQYTMPKSRLEEKTISVSIDTPLDISSFTSKLIAMGYTSAEMVEGPGQFSVRGGIIDLFPTRCEYMLGKESIDIQAPVRIELFGDEIERMALFDATTQRMNTSISSFKITPSREIIADSDAREMILKELDLLISKSTSEDSIVELSKERQSLSLENTSATFYDKFISLIYPEKECLLNYFGQQSLVVLCDVNGIASRGKDAYSSERDMARDLVERGLISKKYASFSAPVSIIDDFYKQHYLISIDPFISSYFERQGGIYHFTTKGVSYANHSLYSITDELEFFSKNKYKIILSCQNEGEAKGAVKALNEMNITATLSRATSYVELPSGVVSVSCDSFLEGFELPDIKFALVVLSSRASKERSSRTKKRNSSKSAGEKILSYNDLNVGDYVVHVSYGIGKYLGLQKLFVMGAYRDYVAIQYAGADKLFLPVDQLDMVAKYIGSTSANGEVKLSKMGGAEWKRATSKAKSAAKEMAKELIDLYARRSRLNGFAFLPDGALEKDFDSSFEYDETEGQLIAIQEIKEDMEKPYPMDRVLCGDVGYGKTEVALRAAMKAIANNKQVAFLVPTTILAMQHFQTALSRFAGTGVNIEMLSRFRTQGEQNLILRKLKRGDIDLVIGTHKLLNKSISFKDIGLLIVDEEQRFGVSQKEKIKQLYPGVDVLTLSATPIPRTLSMTLGGIRDLSVLEEAPTGRVGVQSYVLEYDKGLINDAIRRELHRGGQVFYLHNYVDTIYSVASDIANDFPMARVEVAHGQMDKDTLERIWQRLIQGDIDILVSTTIIETGIDIPNANTLIIENADKMGLSQLHQIRGRVGRSHRRAYAYFTYRKNTALSEIASKRLGAISDFAEFGAGFKIAMRDLEIRGAGNLLGAEQHGHLDAVGYDLYIRLLNEAVLEERGEMVKNPYETKLIVSNDAFLPEKYIPYSHQRIDIYKKIAHIENEDDYKDVCNEMLDRYGPLPREAKMLTCVALVKAYAVKARFSRVEQLKGEIRLYPELINIPLLIEMSSYDREHVFIGGSKTVPYISVKANTSLDFSSDVIKVIKHYIKISEEHYNS